MVGQVFGRYVLVQPLAVGGMGEVHLAVDHGAPGAVAGFRRPCVIKRIKADLLARPDVAGMFAREAACAALLNHSNIVTLLDHGTVDGAAYLALEYVPGINLKLLLDAHRTRGDMVPWTVVAHIARGMAAGLDAAHRARGPDGAALRLIHRDVSPQNVLLGVDGDVKLTDFGMAKGALRGHYETTEQSLKGKLAYLSPEQASGETLDQKTDLFSLGTVLYELATLQHPFGQDVEGFQLLDRVKRAEVAPPRNHRADLPDVYQRVLAACLMRDPRERAGSAREVLLLLEELAGSVKPAPSPLQLHNHLAALGFPAPPRWDTQDVPVVTRESPRPLAPNTTPAPNTQPALARITATSPRPVSTPPQPAAADLEVPAEERDVGVPPATGSRGTPLLLLAVGVALGAGATAVVLQRDHTPSPVHTVAPGPVDLPSDVVAPPNGATPGTRPERAPAGAGRIKPRGNRPDSPAAPSTETPTPVVGTPVPTAASATPVPAAAAGNPSIQPTPVPSPSPAPTPPPAATSSTATALLPAPATVSHTLMTLPSSPGVPPGPGVRFNAHRKVKVSVDGVPSVESLQGKVEVTGNHVVRFDFEGDQYVMVSLREDASGSRTAQVHGNVNGKMLWNGRELGAGGQALAVPRTGCSLSVAMARDAAVITVR